MNEALLSALDLNETEITVFKVVVEAGSIAPAALAKVSGLKRTTAYSVAGTLVEKGLISEDSTRRPRVFSPVTPEQILQLIDQDKKRIEVREGSLRKLANELDNISAGKTYPVPTVRFIEEEKIDAFMRQQTVVWDKILLESGEPTWWGFQDHTFVEHYGGWIRWYWRQSSREIDLKLLSNRAPTEMEFRKTLTEKHFERRQIKFWGEATNFLSTTWAIGDYLVMINTRTRPFYLVEIHDALMAHDQREVFKNLWPLV